LKCQDAAEKLRGALSCIANCPVYKMWRTSSQPRGAAEDELYGMKPLYYFTVAMLLITYSP